MSEPEAFVIGQLAKVANVINVTQDPSRFESPIHRGMNALALLQQAGVPVIGVLYPETVESGTLTVSAPDLVDGTVVWSWAPE